VKIFTFIQFNACNGTGLFAATEKFLEVEYITPGTGYVQLFWVYKLSHSGGSCVGVKLENKILI